MLPLYLIYLTFKYCEIRTLKNCQKVCRIWRKEIHRLMTNLVLDYPKNLYVINTWVYSQVISLNMIVDQYKLIDRIYMSNNAMCFTAFDNSQKPKVQTIVCETGWYNIYNNSSISKRFIIHEDYVNMNNTYENLYPSVCIDVLEYHRIITITSNDVICKIIKSENKNKSQCLSKYKYHAINTYRNMQLFELQYKNKTIGMCINLMDDNREYYINGLHHYIINDRRDDI